MWILGLEGFLKLKMILLTNLQSKSNNSFHRTYLRVAHVCSEKGKDLVSFAAVIRVVTPH